MSGTAKMRAPKATAWRESLPASVTERQRCYAHRAGAQLTVILKPHADDTLVTANVVTPQHARATTFRVPGDTTRRTQAAQIAVAKQWCENEADRLAGAR